MQPGDLPMHCLEHGACGHHAWELEQQAIVLGFRDAAAAMVRQSVLGGEVLWGAYEGVVLVLSSSLSAQRPRVRTPERTFDGLRLSM
jgi:hypothetical protein